MRRLIASFNALIISHTSRVTLFVLGLLMMGLLVAYPYTQARLPSPAIPLEGEWKISPDDTPEADDPLYDDRTWDTVTLPGDLVRYLIRKKHTDQGVIRLRKTVVLPPSLPAENLGLILGRIGNADETSVNGHFIGGMGLIEPREFAMWNFPRTYPLPKEYVNFSGPNVISVRVSVHGMGEVLGNLALVPLKTLGPYSATMNYIRVTMGYVCIAMGMAFFMIFSFFAMRRFQSSEYIYYSLQLVTGLPIILEFCTFWPVYPSPMIRLKILAFSWAALNVFHPIFLHRIYSLSRPKIEALLYVYLSIILFFCLFITTDDTIRVHGPLMIVLTIGIGFYNLSCHVSALINRSPYSRMFSFFGMVVILSAIHDGLAYLSKFSNITVNLFGYTPTVMIFHLGAIFLYMGTSVVLVSRFIGITEEVEELNENLENYIIENARLHEKLEDTSNLRRKPSSISSIAEDKIKQAIQYISENYTETELTREGLASHVGVHPDSFSRQFKQYTGKKLGDFIYEIRINEAARRLREEDTNVIDIAFDVGFESIRTFNRIFPKFMDTTPNKYRGLYRNAEDSEK
jgi:AraC-like DNA-binding protein